MHIFKHFHTITKHRHLVMLHCFKAGIFKRGLLHDLSKYSPAEFCAGAKYYQGTRSPNAKERELYGYSTAWMHHKGRNRHHFEYWNDYNPKTRRTQPVEMPLEFLKEMICDRIAASKVYKGKKYKDSDALDYYNGEKHRLHEIHPKTAEMTEYILTMLAEKGEKETFKYLRSLK
ncbi:MAG: catalase [Ruminococcaceae bacterium]|nr:catalase [Oscillospiraceae bacterium]